MWRAIHTKRNANWAASTGKEASLAGLCHLHLAVGKREGKEKHDTLDLKPLGDVQSSDGGKEVWVPKGGITHGCLPPDSEKYLKGLFYPPQVVLNILGNLRAAQTFVFPSAS